MPDRDSEAPRVHPTRLGRGPSRSRWIPALAVVAVVGLLATVVLVRREELATVETEVVAA